VRQEQAYWMKLNTPSICLGRDLVLALTAVLLQLSVQMRLLAEPNVPSGNNFDLQADKPGLIDFFGPKDAGCFAAEVSNSFQGALALDFVSREQDGFPAGFLNASPPPQGWTHTMWTRDSGAFMRELVFWGYYEHACQVAACLMNFAGTNAAGFIAFPRYFAPARVHESGTEMDGHAGIIIAMVSLWQRLPPNDPFRARLYDFLNRPSSPVRYLDYLLQRNPLIPGSGEFGGGGPKGLYDNVVQNNMCALALLSAAEMEDAAGNGAEAKQWRQDANLIFQNMEKFLVDNDGGWIWCIDPKSLRPDPEVLKKAINVGFGGLNGVACVTADVLGFQPELWNKDILSHSRRTFDDLYNVPLRKTEFRKYGIWSQFDLIHDGLLTSPSYGQGYAIQTMLLFDDLAMADHALHFLTQATFQARGVTFDHGRLSPYYFYERLYSPDAEGKIELTAGCGPLNLVNVAEPLKVARLIVGVDDTSRDEVRVFPRLPASWTGYEAKNWPIRANHGVVRADLSYKVKNGQSIFYMRVMHGESIPALAVRLPGANGPIWKRQSDVKEISVESSFEQRELRSSSH
jgi:hypothetical protein